MWLSNMLLRMFLSIYVVFVVAAKRVTNANRLSCVCSLAECENVNESDCPNGAGTVWDSCKCCRVCARVENEPCGGPFGFSGSCAAGLECVNVNFLDKNAAGVCTRIFNKDVTCEQPKYVSGCNIVNRRCRCERSKSCADDSSPFSFKTRQECQLNLKSMLTRPDDSDDKTDDDDLIDDSIVDDEGDTSRQCPSDSIPASESECKCDMENCPSCEKGWIKTVVKKGQGVPGECCDQFTCAIPDKNCANVQCPEIPPCPSDSYRLPAFIKEGECCPASRGCQCLPTCDTITCQNDTTPTIISEGSSDHPGRCCPVYQCTEPGGSGTDVGNPDEPTQNSRDCLSDNMIKKHGANWTSSDFCTTCTCKDGEAICHAFTCDPCLKPTPVPGQCCPHCDNPQPPHCPQLSNCTERCPNGNLEDKNGCATCQCRQGCPQDCVSEIDSKGEQICRCDKSKPATCPTNKCDKICIFGFQKDEFNCDTCECKKCNKQCARGYLTNGKGISTCKCKPWSLPGSSSLRAAESRPCKTEGNVLRDSGETWFDGCRQCSCIAGTEMCSLIHCSPFNCERPIVNATSNCCPFCPEDPKTNKEISHMVCLTPNGDVMLEGETSKLDDCTTCICHEGMALCRSKECPPTVCSNPKPPGPKDCCPTCLSQDDDEDSLKPLRAENDMECSNSSANNTAWRETSCLSCRCIGNKKYCYTELCDSVSKCKRSLTIKGRCCPICIDDADKYKFEGMCINSSHANGDEWSVDLCTRCKCIDGLTKCKPICPSACSRVSETLDRCCSSCDASKFHSMPELLYIVVLLLVVCVSVALFVYVMRHCRSKKQQMRLGDLSCYPPQYPYKYVPTSPYDNKSSQKIILSEKASLAPV